MTSLHVMTSFWMNIMTYTASCCVHDATFIFVFSIICIFPYMYICVVSVISGFTALPPVTHAVTTCMMYLNHSCNFLIYCLSGMYCYSALLLLIVFETIQKQILLWHVQNRSINSTWLWELLDIVIDYYQQLSKNDSWQLWNGLCCFFFVNRFLQSVVLDD